MKKSNSLLLATLLAVSLISGSCGSSGNNTTKEETTSGAVQNPSSTDQSSKIGTETTYWKAELEETLEYIPRTVELFLFADGTFHLRDFRQSYYSFNGTYFHLPSDETKWRLDDKKLELEFLTNSPSKRVIYDAEYTGDEIIADDFISEEGRKLVFKKSDSIPKLSGMEEDSGKLEGEWIEVIDNKNYSHYMVEDFYTPSVMQITKEGDSMTATYTFQKETFTGNALTDESFVDATVVLKDEPLFDGSLNEFWHAQLTDATEATPENTPISRTLTLVNDDMLILDQTWTMPEEDMVPYEETQETSSETSGEDVAVTETSESAESTAETTQEGEGGEGEDGSNGEMFDYGYEPYVPERTTTQIFLRKDSELYKNRDDLRYRNVVTVSTVSELANALADNTKIILKEGVYNVSELPADEETGELSTTLNLTGKSNLCLEAESKKKVEIVTNDSYSPVITLEYSDSIELRGLTVGHNIEPGYCSGSVISSNESGTILVENCYLYGCGTYGLEASNTNDVIFKQTEIYECTYGLFALYNCSNIAVKDSILRDSKNLIIFDTYNTSDFLVENSKITNNAADFEYSDERLFIRNAEGSGHIFRKCEFVNNQYKTLSEGDVKFEDCTFQDNVQ